MRIIHAIKAAMLRRALIRQRAENIRGIRAGRAAARAIRRALVRNLRLAGSERQPASEQNAGFLTISPIEAYFAGHPAFQRAGSADSGELPKLERAETT